MALIVKQANPLAATLTALHTVTAQKALVGSSIVVCNRSAVDTSFRISIAIAGAADSLEQYLYYNTLIPGNETFVATIGPTANAGDIIRVYATLATLSFTLFGTEN